MEELWKNLTTKRRLLEAKDAEANKRLQRMIADRREAESKKAASIEIQAALLKQDQYIKKRNLQMKIEKAEHLRMKNSVAWRFLHKAVGKRDEFAEKEAKEERCE